MEESADGPIVASRHAPTRPHGAASRRHHALTFQSLEDLNATTSMKLPSSASCSTNSLLPPLSERSSQKEGGSFRTCSTQESRSLHLSGREGEALPPLSEKSRTLMEISSSAVAAGDGTEVEGARDILNASQHSSEGKVSVVRGRGRLSFLIVQEDRGERVVTAALNTPAPENNVKESVPNKDQGQPLTHQKEENSSARDEEEGMTVASVEEDVTPADHEDEEKPSSQGVITENNEEKVQEEEGEVVWHCRPSVRACAFVFQDRMRRNSLQQEQFDSFTAMRTDRSNSMPLMPTRPEGGSRRSSEEGTGLGGRGYQRNSFLASPTRERNNEDE